MIAVWIAVGLAVGYLAARWEPRPQPGQSRAIAVRGDAPDRPHPLEDLIESARALALRIVVRADGFDVIDQLHPAEMLVLRVADPKQVTTSTIRMSTTSSVTLPFVVALALVPLFGPLALTIDRETYRIDGTRDQHELTGELSARLTARAREVLAQRTGA